MKKIFLTVSLLLFLFSSSHAQQTVKFYYPLNDGDIFQYHFDFGSTFVGTHTRTVIGDTLMPNGKTYKKLESDFIGFFSPQEIRVANGDSVFRYYGPNERLLFPLNLDVGLTWPIDQFAFQEIRAIRDTILWDNSFQYAEVATFSSIDSTLIWTIDFLFADTLGVIYDPVEGGQEQLTGAIINGKQYGTITSVKSKELSQQEFIATNYPNPFNHSTRISYALNSPARVKIHILNILGKEVQSFDRGMQQAGSYTNLWQGDNHEGAIVSSGLYFYLIKSKKQVLYKGSMTFVK